MNPDTVQAVVQKQKDLVLLCRIEGDQIAFRKEPEDEDSFYRVPLHRVRSYQHIVWEIGHLIEKSWMTLPLLERFIEVSCVQQGLSPRGDHPSSPQ